VIDHIVVNVRNLKESRRFYDQALAPLGYRLVKEFPGGIGYGMGAKADFWMMQREPHSEAVHVAFACGTRSLVDAFHAAALSAGGKDFGGPGIRAHYHADYYGAFVLDPDGNNIEAICHEAQAPTGKRGRT
jgi:catechol 2,3-dioxygenase-like lactoylglutathione lyase family enzyme